jgi:predicted nucleic acid-binding protein
MTLYTARGNYLTWFRDHLPAGQLILDASAIINLLASKAAADVFRTLAQPCLVEDKVFGEIVRHPIPGLCQEKELRALEEAGFIVRASMDGTEYAKYLTLVQAPLPKRLDAGESATLVVAEERRLVAVIDENKARTYVTENLPLVRTVSTLSLFISATVRSDRDVAFLQTLVESAREHARMGVPKEERPILNAILCR